MPVKAIATLPISLLLVPFFGTEAVVSAQTRFTLQTMPRIDVHAHIGDMELMKDYVQTADTLRERYGINLSTWIDLRAPLDPDSGVKTPWRSGEPTTHGNESWTGIRG